MPWRGHNGHFCKRCGRHRSECGKLSARYVCADCGDVNSTVNRQQLRAHAGPYFDHWRRRSLAALGVIVADEPAEN